MFTLRAPKSKGETAMPGEKQTDKFEADIRSFQKHMYAINGGLAVLVLILTLVGGIVINTGLDVLRKMSALEATAIPKDQMAELKSTVNHQARDIDRLEVVVEALRESVRATGTEKTSMTAYRGEFVKIEDDKLVMLSAK